MKSWKSLEEILDYAIGEEEGAVKFYTELAEKVASAGNTDVGQASHT